MFPIAYKDSIIEEWLKRHGFEDIIVKYGVKKIENFSLITHMKEETHLSFIIKEFQETMKEELKTMKLGDVYESIEEWLNDNKYDNISISDNNGYNFLIGTVMYTYILSNIILTKDETPNKMNETVNIVNDESIYNYFLDIFSASLQENTKEKVDYNINGIKNLLKEIQKVQIEENIEKSIENWLKEMNLDDTIIIETTDPLANYLLSDVIHEFEENVEESDLKLSYHELLKEVIEGLYDLEIPDIIINRPNSVADIVTLYILENKNILLNRLKNK